MFSSNDLLGNLRQSRRRQSYLRPVAVSSLAFPSQPQVSQSYLCNKCF